MDRHLLEHKNLGDDLERILHRLSILAHIELSRHILLSNSDFENENLQITPPILTDRGYSPVDWGIFVHLRLSFRA